MARRLTADLPRRPRLRREVEHGLDARHARLLPAGPDPPPLPPPRADLQPDVRLQRELHPPAQPRRGGARQAIADRQDAGRPLAGVCQPAGAVRLHVGSPRQEAAVHGPGVRPAVGVEPRALARLAPARAAPSTQRFSRSSATSTASTAASRRCGTATSSPEGFRWLEPNDADANVVAFAALLARRRSAWWCASPTTRRSCARATAWGCPRGGRWRELLNTDSRFYAGTDVGNGGMLAAEPLPWHEQSHSVALTLPPLGVLWLVPEAQCPRSRRSDASTRSRLDGAALAGDRSGRIPAATARPCSACGRRARRRVHVRSRWRGAGARRRRARRLRGRRTRRRRRRLPVRAARRGAGERRCSPTPARVISPRACAGPRACSTPAASRGPTPAGRRRPLGRARALRAARRHVHRGGHLRGGGASTCPSSRSSASTRSS